MLKMYSSLDVRQKSHEFVLDVVSGSEKRSQIIVKVKI